MAAPCDSRVKYRKFGGSEPERLQDVAMIAHQWNSGSVPSASREFRAKRPESDEIVESHRLKLRFFALQLADSALKCRYNGVRRGSNLSPRFLQ